MGGKKKKNRAKKVTLREPKDIEDYEVSESDDGLGPDGKIMLERAKHGRYIQDESEDEVLRVHSSDDSEGEDEEAEAEGEEEEEEEGGEEAYYGGGVGSDFDSDIEGKGDSGDDGLPSSKAWGKGRKKYYDTDYVDQDFGGMGAKEEEAALMEEAEASAIQRRMLAELEGTDVTLGLLDKVEEKRAELAEKAKLSSEAEKIQTDLSALTKDEKLRFLKTESPEFFSLVADFKERMKFLEEKLRPVMGLVEKDKLPKSKATEAVILFNNIILTYCTNICYYLVVKSSRGRVDPGHPVLARLVSLRKLLKEMDKVFGSGTELGKQLELIAKTPVEELQVKTELGGEEANKGNRAERRKRKLRLVEEMKEVEKKAEEKRRRLEGEKEEAAEKKGVRFQEPGSEEEEEEQDSEGEGEDQAEEGGEEVEGERRGITYTMAKNKGLTPKKRKELRNPRVKHRNKFRKAKIRRKGQVREVRTETSRYGGEISGVKAYVSKSIKFKS